jgi:hypothetical protein
MAEELSGQADQLQDTMAFFRLRSETARLLTDGTSAASGSSGPLSHQSVPQNGNAAEGNGHHKAVKAGRAASPTTASSSDQAHTESTGITIPMGANGNGRSGDPKDDEFEEY